MHEVTTSAHERLISAGATGAILALFGFVLIEGLTIVSPGTIPDATSLFSLRAPPPPKPPEPPKKRSRTDVAKRRSSSAASHPGASAAPRPKHLSPPILPVPPVLLPVTVALAPASGGDGRSGSGQDSGTGTGGGAGGDGTGTGGGDGGQPPRFIRGRLKFSDLPEAMRAGWTGGTVTVRYDVEIDGRVGACMPIASSGSAELDRLTCQLIRQRFRYHPAREQDGTPVQSTIEEEHGWEIDRVATAAQPPK